MQFDFSEKLAAQEKEMIEAALRETKGRVPGTILDWKIKSKQESLQDCVSRHESEPEYIFERTTNFRNLTNLRNTEIY